MEANRQKSNNRKTSKKNRAGNLGEITPKTAWTATSKNFLVNEDGHEFKPSLAIDGVVAREGTGFFASAGTDKGEYLQVF